MKICVTQNENRKIILQIVTTFNVISKYPIKSLEFFLEQTQDNILFYLLYICLN